ncbi:MAG: restriction endonuclease subunit S [Desulfobacteraceae bacterium]|jgi:type I restriction enzyme S subunit
MRRQTYSKYKPSGVKWLEQIPEHWQFHRAKVLFRQFDERSTTGEEELLTVSHITGVTLRSAKNVYMFMADSLEGYKKCEAGDLVINTMWAWMGAMGISPEAGIVSPSYNVYRFRNTKCEAWFYDYLFRTAKFVTEVICHSKGVWSSRLRLYPEEFFEIRIPYPPFEEQWSIVNFLNRESAEIDTLIDKKQKQIDFLQEKRLALVHEAIQTEGTLDLRLGKIVEQVFRDIDKNDENMYVPIGLYNRGRGIFHKEPTLGAELGNSDFFLIKPGDLVLSGQFAWEGAVALVGENDIGCVATHRYPILRGKAECLDTAYLWAFLTTKMGDFVLNEHSRGAAGRNRPLNMNSLLKEKIPVPPVQEQLKVVSHVYFENQLKKKVNESIRLLAEYRTALISAAVTGKIDVRKEVS